MAEPFLAEAPIREVHEIPAYVVRPQAGPRYQPDRGMFRRSLRELRDSYRPSMKSRLASAWKQRLNVTVIAPPAPTHAPSDLDPIGVVRYEAKVLRAGRLPVASLVGAALLVAGAGLGWWIGAHSQPAPQAKAPVVQAKKSVAPAAKVAKPAARTAVITYTAKAGDTFTALGSQFGLSAHTVRVVNDLPLGARLNAGQKLLIPPVDGSFHRIRRGETIGILASRNDLTPDQILTYNAGINPTHLHLGQKVFVPGVSAFTSSDGGKTYHDDTPSPRAYRSPFAKRLSASRSLIGLFGNRVGQLLMPVKGEFSSPFGVRGASFHPGMDICNVIGTPIHAAKAGTVLSAGWAGAYGYAVDLDHGGGVVTRYAHCSKVLVRPGQMVTEGQEIAKMGSTGHSTGPHCHFEVRIQGRAVNPAPFF